MEHHQQTADRRPRTAAGLVYSLPNKKYQQVLAASATQAAGSQLRLLHSNTIINKPGHLQLGYDWALAVGGVSPVSNWSPSPIMARIRESATPPQPATACHWLPTAYYRLPPTALLATPPYLAPPSSPQQ